MRAKIEEFYERYPNGDQLPDRITDEDDAGLAETTS